MKTKNSRKIIAAAAAAIMLCTCTSAAGDVSDATVQSYEEQLNSIKDKQAAALARLEAVRSEQTTAYTEMGTLDELIRYNSELKTLAEGQLDEIERHIEETKALILETEEAIERQEKALSDRITLIKEVK